MVGVDVIVAALAAGASAGVSGTTSEAIQDGYAVLKALIRRRFGGRDTAREALEADETEPGVWQTRIGQDLRDSGAADDEQVLAAARELLGLAGAARAFFTRAVADGLIPAGASPAHQIRKPRRLPSPRRALTPRELAEINQVARTSGNDVVWMRCCCGCTHRPPAAAVAFSRCV